MSGSAASLTIGTERRDADISRSATSNDETSFGASTIVVAMVHATWSCSSTRYAWKTWVQNSRTAGEPREDTPDAAGDHVMWSSRLRDIAAAHCANGAVAGGGDAPAINARRSS